VVLSGKNPYSPTRSAISLFLFVPGFAPLPFRSEHFFSTDFRLSSRNDKRQAGHLARELFFFKNFPPIVLFPLERLEYLFSLL